MGKITLIFSLAVLLLLAGAVFAEDVNYSCANYSDGSSRIRGDIDGDGKITINDYEIASKMQEGTLQIPSEKCCAYIPTAANPDPKILVSSSAINYIMEGIWTSAGTCANPITPRLIKYNCDNYSDGSSRIRGDIDGDGKVTSEDASIISSIAYKNIAGPINSCCADIIQTYDVIIVGNQTMDDPITTADWTAINNIVSGEYSSAGTCANPIDPTKPIACTMEYAPVCGEKQVQCITTPCDPIKQTYSNKCMAEADKAKVLYTGECSGTCAKEGEMYSSVYSEYPSKCCDGLTEWSSGFDTRVIKEGKCVETGRVSGAPVGTCLNCGNGICEGKENICNCPKDCGNSTCICTEEYAPVCGVFKSNENKKTYSNACFAKCAGIDYYTKGKCEADCPIYSAPYCPNGTIVSVYDEKGCLKPKCVESNEQHFKGAYWKCSNGTEGKQYDSCMPYSYWKNFARNQCEAIQTKCGQITNQVSTSTGSQGPSSGGTSSNNVVNTVSNFILQTVQAVSGNATQTTTQQETKCYGAPTIYLEDFRPLEECNPNNKICEYLYEDGCKIVKCSDGEYTKKCEVQECKYYIDEKGCKVKACINGETEVACPTDGIIPITPLEEKYKSAKWSCYSGKEYNYNIDSCMLYSDWKEKAISTCENECADSTTSTNEAKCGVNSLNVYDSCGKKEPVLCNAQTPEQITELKTKCYANNMDVVINLDAKGCKEYTCKEKKIGECLKTEEIPKEKKINCEENGGTFIVKENSDGCVAVVECAGEKAYDSNQEINKDVLNDKIKLLDLALKLEEVKMELSKIQAKIQAIADYYKQEDKNIYSNYEKAVALLEDAKTKVDEAKTILKENVDSMTEDKVIMVRELIREIKETVLKEVLLALLG